MTEKSELPSLTAIFANLQLLKWQLADHCERQDFYPCRNDFEILIDLRKVLRDTSKIADQLFEVWIGSKRI